MCVPFVFTHNNTTEIIIQGLNPVKGWFSALVSDCPTNKERRKKTRIICIKHLKMPFFKKAFWLIFFLNCIELFKKRVLWKKVCLIDVGINCKEWRDVTKRWEAQGTSRRTMLSLGRILCCWSEFEYIKENSGKKKRGVQHSLCSPGPLCGKRGRLAYVFLFSILCLVSTTNLAFFRSPIVPWVL